MDLISIKLTPFLLLKKRVLVLFNLMEKSLTCCHLGGLKGQKIAQNEKYQLHVSCAISQEQYST